MSRLKVIKVHDLMEIRADEGEETCDIPSGLYIALAIIDMPSGPNIDAAIVGSGNRGTVNITKRNAHLVKRVLRMSGVPGAIEALEQIARGEIVVEDKQTGGLARVFLMTYGRSKGGCEAFESFCFAAYNLAKRALYAVRGEETK